MDRQQLEAAIAAQESMRGTIADEIIDTTLDALRRQLSAFDVDTSDRRRQVTVLFADVSGFTAMSEDLDAEEVRDIMNDVWGRLDATIVEHGGRVDKHIGDAVMAVWGAESVREDDPERAVRAGLAMQDALALYRRETHTDLRMRIGVNTGRVMLGAVGSTDEFTALGDTVNLASRLEHAAPLDGVLIAHDTYRHVKGVFTVAVQDPLEFKGKRQPVRTYVASAVRPRAFRLGTRGVEGVETRMVGRDRELDLLRSMLAESIHTESLRVVTVAGDVGVGKSRLLYEFEDWLRLQPTEVRLFRSRADSQHSSVPHFVIRDLLFSRFSIADDMPRDEARTALIDGLRSLAPTTADRELELISAMVGLAPSSGAPGAAPTDQDRAATWSALAAFFERVGRELPAVILIEDLHWADRASRDAIAELTRRGRGVRGLVVQLTRPSLLTTGAARVDDADLRIDLAPLDESSTRLLIEEVLQNAEEVPVTVFDRLAAVAAGNPFYVEELVKMLIEEGAITTTADSWTIDPYRLERIRPPATITGVLEARLDRLPPVEWRVLEAAAVVGQTFWDAALPTLDDEPRSPDDVAAALASLEARELVFRTPTSSFDGAQQYIFKHALLHEVTYDHVLQRDRSRLHRSVAGWLIRHGDEHALAGPIAGHFASAGDDIESAIWSARAGHDAIAQLAFADAVPHLEAARSATGLTSEVREQVLSDLSEVLGILARHEEALAIADQLTALTPHDSPNQALAMRLRSYHLTRLGRFGEALACLERAEKVLAMTDAEPVDRMTILTERGWTLLRLGRLDEAISSGRASLALAPQVNDLRELRAAHSQLGVAYDSAGNLAEAEHHLVTALDLARQRGDRRNEAADLINLGVFATARGEHALAAQRHEEALAIVREIGDLDQEALALTNLGGVRVTQLAFDVAIEHLTAALALFEAAHAGEHTSESHDLLARAHLGRGDLDAARAEAIAALELAVDTGNPQHLGNAWLTFGSIAHRWGGRVDTGTNTTESESTCVERGAGILVKAGMQAELRVALHQLAVIHTAAGEADAAENRHRRAEAKEGNRA
jgi:class 3 adenylate cyclase/tetratricopeptide (TPR) repeat protein